MWTGSVCMRGWAFQCIPSWVKYLYSTLTHLIWWFDYRQKKLLNKDDCCGKGVPNAHGMYGNGGHVGIHGWEQVPSSPTPHISKEGDKRPSIWCYYCSWRLLKSSLLYSKLPLKKWLYLAVWFYKAPLRRASLKAVSLSFGGRVSFLVVGKSSCIKQLLWSFPLLNAYLESSLLSIKLLRCWEYKGGRSHGSLVWGRGNVLNLGTSFLRPRKFDGCNQPKKRRDYSRRQIVGM